jgi:hypothetical protein
MSSDNKNKNTNNNDQTNELLINSSSKSAYRIKLNYNIINNNQSIDKNMVISNGIKEEKDLNSDHLKIRLNKNQLSNNNGKGLHFFLI